jgi:hypothetical protein
MNCLSRFRCSHKPQVRQRSPFFSPPCEGGVRGGGPNTFDTSKSFTPRMQLRPFPAVVKRGRRVVISAPSITGSSEGRALRLGPAPRPATDWTETQNRCQRLPCPPPLAPPSQRGERKGSRVLGFQSRAIKTFASQSCFRSSHHQLFITPGHAGAGTRASDRVGGLARKPDRSRTPITVLLFVVDWTLSTETESPLMDGAELSNQATVRALIASGSTAWVYWS